MMGGEAAPRAILEQEWWLAAIQEPLTEFALFLGDDWPTSTLPAFEVAWCAVQQSEAALLDLNLRIHRAFFAEGRNTGRRDVLLELAQAVGIDVRRVTAELDSGRPREAVLERGAAWAGALPSARDAHTDAGGRHQTTTSDCVRANAGGTRGRCDATAVSWSGVPASHARSVRAIARAGAPVVPDD